MWKGEFVAPWDWRRGERLKEVRIGSAPTPITRFGFFVFRWLRLTPGSLDEWIELCNETWPNFQQRSRSECLAVWEVDRDDHLVDEVLMCTWYEDLHSWDHSREVDSADAAKWRRRAELEYNHWGIGARRMR